MVNGTGIPRLVTLPSAAPRGGALSAQRSAVFSTMAKAAAVIATAPKTSAVSLAPVVVAPTRQSQANAAVVDVRQLFSGVSGAAAGAFEQHFPVRRRGAPARWGESFLQTIRLPETSNCQ